MVHIMECHEAHHGRCIAWWAFCSFCRWRAEYATKLTATWYGQLHAEHHYGI
jgi:hypothetical protein